MKVELVARGGKFEKLIVGEVYELKVDKLYHGEFLLIEGITAEEAMTYFVVA